MRTLDQRDFDSPEPKSVESGTFCEKCQKVYSMQLLKNPLAPWRTGQVVYAIDSDIGGDRDEEHLVKVTTFEIELILRHWAAEIRHWRYFAEVYQQGGEWQWIHRARSRLAYFETILGDERLSAVVDAVLEGADAEIETARESYTDSMPGCDQGQVSSEGCEAVSDESASTEREQAELSL